MFLSLAQLKIPSIALFSNKARI